MLVTTLAALGSVFFSMLSGAVAGDVCRNDCGTEVNIAIIGVWWGGILLAGLVGRIGIRRAKRRGEPTSVWASTALILVIASTVVGVLVVDAVSGMG